MQPYTRGFAEVYDILMDHIPYGEWADYIEQLMHENEIKSGLILDLGCGTGKMTREMASRGYDMIGIDFSEEMLSIAREYPGETEKDILYLCQDMREFELYGTVAGVISACTSVNYISEQEDLLKIFRLVNNYLDPGGLFIFDLDTPYGYGEVIGDTSYAVNREEGSFIWENTYYPEEMINEVELTLFVPRENGFYEKLEETHVRRAYSIENIRCLIEEAGMEWVGVYDERTKKQAEAKSERVYIVAREKHHEGKLYISS